MTVPSNNQRPQLPRVNNSEFFSFTLFFTLLFFVLPLTNFIILFFDSLHLWVNDKRCEKGGLDGTTNHFSLALRGTFLRIPIYRWATQISIDLSVVFFVVCCWVKNGSIEAIKRYCTFICIGQTWYVKFKINTREGLIQSLASVPGYQMDLLQNIIMNKEFRFESKRNL